MTELSEPYVTGLLADLEPLVPTLEAELRQARGRASGIDAELSRLLVQLDDVKRALTGQQRAAEQSATALAEHNSRTASVHQEIAALKTRAEDFRAEMGRVGESETEVYARLRRERAKILVQVEDRDQELVTLKAAADQARSALGQAELGVQQEKDKTRLYMGELDRLQAQLPKPHLYLRLFEARLARAHCRLFLDRDPSVWRDEVRAAIEYISELHRELRAGKYRLDKNSDLVGGRATGSAEALYAATALGDDRLAVALFATIADPALMFDQVFNVFRVWCLGLYLAGRRAELEALLDEHGYSIGLRGGYVESFRGLLTRDARRVSAGLKLVARHEWEMWQDPKLMRGVGVVSVGATALARLALDLGLAVKLPGPMVPDDVIAGPRRAEVRR